MLDSIFPDLKKIECARCSGCLFNKEGPFIEEVTYIDLGILVSDEWEFYNYICNNCGLVWREFT